MQVTVPDLTAQECGFIAITAAEGGIGYWSVIDKYEFERWYPDGSDEPKDVPDDFVYYTIRYENPNGPGQGVTRVTPALIRKGFERGCAAPSDEGGWLFTSVLKEPREDWAAIDAIGADATIQFGIFGELVFG